MRILAYTALLIAVGVYPAAAFDGPTQSKGGTKSAPASGSAAKPAAEGAAKAKPKTAPPGEKLYNAGIKAYEAGKHADAIKHLGAAIRAGGLQKTQIAKALYYRGLAFRKKGKPGQAISDLTSAYWLNEGLTTAQRSDALSNRNAAYREAGISNAPAASESVVVAAEPAVMSAPSLGASTSGWETATLGKIASPATNASSTSQSTSPAPAMAAAPASKSSTSASDSGSSGGVGGFFSSITNLFTGGGSSSSQSAPSQSKNPDTTGSIATKPETSSWTQTTQVAAAPPSAKPTKPAQVATPFATQVATAAPPAKPKKPAQVTTPFTTQVAAVTPPAVAVQPKKPKVTSAPSGKYRLQVAAVRSRSEADAVAARLMQKYGGKLGQRRPVVDEAVIGSMGTFYRVRVGPYANAKEPQQLCGTLRTSGFDCLVVTQ
ncbi:MAG: SPOR domain-containing protein [Hyphomicrobium sp.]